MSNEYRIQRFVIACVLISCATIGLYKHLQYKNSYQIIFKKFYSSSVYNDTVDCYPDIPCVYPEVVNFRVIVITYNRAQSLSKLLNTLDSLELDGDSARLEIWIDRKKNGEVDSKTLEVARSFNWTKGPTRVHIQKRNVGIYGQWIDTWAPTDHSEIGVTLEDDLIVSPHIYRWFKAAHKFYGNRTDYWGANLVTDEMKTLDGSFSLLKGPKNHTAFLYKNMGTWGHSPLTRNWPRFQHWFHKIARPDPKFRPYIPNIAPTEWYKQFERQGYAHSMWEMWLLYFTYIEKKYTLHSNLNTYVGDGKSCLSINRREVGLHNSHKGNENLCQLLTVWKDEYIAFPNDTLTLDWNGKAIKGY